VKAWDESVGHPNIALNHLKQLTVKSLLKDKVLDSHWKFCESFGQLWCESFGQPWKFCEKFWTADEKFWTAMKSFGQPLTLTNIEIQTIF